MISIQAFTIHLLLLTFERAVPHLRLAQLFFSKRVVSDLLIHV